MNIVKGVADLLRRTSGGQTGDVSSWQQVERFSAPSQRIQFGEVGDEAVLYTLWKRHENTTDKVEKRKLLQIFIMHFLRVYKNWEPDVSSELQNIDEMHTGCSIGHPTEIILVLVQETVRLTASITELQSTPNLSEASVSLNIGSEGINVLDALTIVSRSVYNCKVFVYHGGMQKLTALMKAAVVQLKSLISVFAEDECMPFSILEKIAVLQKILVYIVTIICNVIDLNPKVHDKVSETYALDHFPSKENTSLDVQVISNKGINFELRREWQQKAITSVLEAGGLNWLVELLRVVKRLSLKEQLVDISVQHLTLKALRCSLSENSRAQNHFRSIGGLEVLLDGLSLPSSSTLALKNAFLANNERNAHPMNDVFQLQILSLEVLREAVFGNLNNMQFLCENGRIQKFANNLCWPAFMIQEVQRGIVESSVEGDNHMPLEEIGKVIQEVLSRSWNEYVLYLSRVLCSFLLALEDIEFHCIQASVGHTSRPVSFVYSELSIKWTLKVLRTVFPCIKACSTQNELPAHLRILASTLQHYVLYTYRKVLVSSPILLEVFREEGVWDVIFSENFFYFGPTLDESSGESHRYLEDVSRNSGTLFDSHVGSSEVDILQMEIISFVEFAATLNGNTQNLQECSVLLETLEQSACNPGIASVLVRSLHRILQLSCEQTVVSFKTLDAIARVLNISCIEAQELRSLSHEHKRTKDGVEPDVLDSIGSSEKWIQCMEDSFELFTEYLNTTDDAKLSVLHNPKCIDCLFDLFWDERLRKLVLEYILEFLKLPLYTEDDKTAKLQLCSKYLETFTRAKDMENGFAELSIDLLVGMRDVLLLDQMYYQDLFRDGECFLHIVSLLNGSLDKKTGEPLVLNVLQTLTCLLTGNDNSKAAFRALVGVGYQTLQSLLFDVCQWQPSMELLNSLLDMLVDGKFDDRRNLVIKNEDVIILFFNVLRKSSDVLQHYGLDVFLHLISDSISNQASCYRAGMLSFLLDWFSFEDNDDVVWKITQLIQVIGRHSISGTDIRKIFALLRSEKVGLRPKYCSLLLSSIQSMLKVKGPTAFFELSGIDSGILIKTPIQWPYNKGFSFSCWVRVESFPSSDLMGLFSLRTENGRGCSAVFGRDKLVVETVNQKRQCVSLSLNLIEKKWQFLCITHSIGRAFSGGSLLRCYVDGDLFSMEKCRYAKVSDTLTHCSIGSKIVPAPDEDSTLFPFKDSLCLRGQLGPIYMFADAISPEQVKGIFSFGPSYMYSFHDSDDSCNFDTSLSNGILDAKEGLASKIICGLNAQASNGRSLFNVAPLLDPTLDKNLFQAAVMSGTQLCSRRLLQHIIYCVGGVSVFFPLLTQFDRNEKSKTSQLEYTSLRSITRDRLATEVIELIASVLDENPANQQQMYLLSGFPILGFLLRSVPPPQLSLEAVSALKHLLNVVKKSDISELLVRDAILAIYLNPHIWVYADFNVQRELYMLLIQHFENDNKLLTSSCRLPQIIDIIRQFYWDKAIGRSAFGCKPLLHPATGEIIAERPSQDEIHKIRLLLLSLAEMSLRQNIEASDIKALVAFFERNQDMVCIEDILHMVIRFVSQKPLLAAFLEQVNSLGGCHIFLNLLSRELEPIRLLALQFIGKLLFGLPSEKKGPKLFNLGVARGRSISESHRKANTTYQPIVSAMSDRLFMFPHTDNLCATLFDVLLGGASPKQVLQMCSLPEKQRSKQLSPGSSSHFVLPQILILIFNILSSCDDTLARIKIWRDLLDLLDSNPSNAEAFMENAWSSWLSLLLRLDVFKNYKAKSLLQAESLERNEQSLARSLFCSVLTHYTCWVKGGWQQLEETVNSLLLICEQGSCSCKLLIRDIFEDLLESLVKLSSEYNIFLSQPCRDNTLFLLQSVDEMLINEQGHLLPFPGNCLSSDFSPEFFESENQKEVAASVFEALSKGFNEEDLRTVQVDMMDDWWWILYEKVWIVICELNDKGPSKSVTKTATQVGPSLGQRARGLVESLNIPAAEMAAVVVSGGIGSALSGKSHKYIDKAMLLRGEKCPRIVFRLVILYVCHAGLEQTSRCVQHFLSLLPGLLTADDEQNKNRLQLFIWSLLTVRSHCEMTDEGARFHVISHLIRETVHYGKSLLLTSIQGKEDLSNSGTNMKEAGMVHNLIQKERLLCAVEDEAKYVKALKTDRLVQIQDLRIRLEENSSGEIIQKKALEEEIQTNLSLILTADDKRRSAAQLAVDEYQQVVAAKWVHVFRTLVDERGPWSANAFPNSTVKHWKHDKTEDLWRRRPKLKRNYHFDEQLCHPPASTVSTAMDSAVDDGTASFKDYVPEKMKRFLLKGIRGITEDGSSEVYDMDTDVNGAKAENSLDQNTDLGQDTDDQEASTTARAETDEVLLSVPCVLVTPKRKLAGHLAIMHNVLHFFGEFLVEGTGGSSVFNNFGSKAPTGSDSLTGAHKYRNQKVSVSSDGDDIRANSLVNLDNLSGALKQGDKVKRHRRWNVLKIKAVHWTRYLLRYTALEIFFNSSVAPVFFNFSSQQEAKDVGTLIVNTRNEALFPKGTARDRNAIISFVDRRVALEMAETARESWRRREMSNFEYLIILNTLAGRSYNDLTQYLIFPWILADYTSEKLDFNKSSTFRDLTKPVGALDFKRFEVFEDRYQNFSDPDIPSFYYGSHYSSMGIVLYYLLRLEPFTALHRHLQGGKFDHADRLFQSIESTYRNCLSNTSDVKELIPEFFYMPEFLVNSNSYHLGVKQDGEPLGDVTLPPWAKGSPEEFIHKNREALESEFVSSNLHHWIDLVFGYKQRGKPAVEAANVFYYLTYEGAVDLDTMDDELQSSAIEDQIANFGQTPIQIFRKKHPRRGPPIPIAHPLYFAPASISLTSVISNTTHQSAVLFVGVFDASVLLVNSGLTMSVKLWVTTQLQSGGNFTFSSSQEPFFGIGPDVLSPRRINTPMAENVELGRQNFAIMQTPSENFLISCGNWENSFQIICLNDGKVVQSVRHHKDIVSCVAVSSDGSVLATGSYDTTIMLWEVSNVRTIERKVKNAPTDLPTKNRLILESPFHILCGHDDIITCLFVSVELDLVISGSRDGTCIFHSLRKGCYIRSIRHPSGSPLSKLVASQHGRIVFYSHNDLSFHLYSINGKHVASSESNGRLNCVELSSCGEFLVCAGDHGQIVVRSMHSLETVRRYDGIGKIITALTVTPEECFLAGTKDGTLLVYSIDNPQIKKGSVHRTKYKTSAVG